MSENMSVNFNFSGDCAGAIDMYSRAFGVKPKGLMRYGEAPDHGGANDGQMDYVYHCEMEICGVNCMFADFIDEEFLQGGQTLALTVTLENADSVMRTFDLLMDGGKVIRYMKKTFFSPCVVTLEDRYGVRWGLMAKN